MSSILNTELEDEIQSLEDERALSNEYFSELQAEFEAEKQALVARVEGLQNTAALNTTAKIELDSLQMKLEESEREKASLEEKFYSWREKYASLESDVARLQNELVSAAEEKRQFEEMWTAASEEGSMRNKELEIQVKEMREKLANVDEHEQMLTQVIEEKLQLEENKKLEVDSLQMVLEERTREKEQLEKNLETWREKYASLECDVTRLQDELASAVEEKRRFEERLSCVSDEDSEKTRELQIQVKQLEERLSHADEQEQMLTQVIEQKLLLEENLEHLKAELAQSKECYEVRSEEFKTEQEAKITQLTKELEHVKKQLQTASSEFGEKEVIQQKRDVDAKVVSSTVLTIFKCSFLMQIFLFLQPCSPFVKFKSEGIEKS